MTNIDSRPAARRGTPLRSVSEMSWTSSQALLAPVPAEVSRAMPCDLDCSSDSAAAGTVQVPARLDTSADCDPEAEAAHDTLAKPSDHRRWAPLMEACAADLEEAIEVGDAASMPLLVKAVAEFALVERGAIHLGSRRAQQAFRIGRLSLARRLITLHLAHPALSPAMVAELLGVSVRYVHVLFEATGKSFWQTVTARRISQARSMLHDTPQRPIAEIAYACGFGSLATFYRVFSVHEGQAPGEFRSRDRAGNLMDHLPLDGGAPSHLTGK